MTRTHTGFIWNSRSWTCEAWFTRNTKLHIFSRIVRTRCTKAALGTIQYNTIFLKSCKLYCIFENQKTRIVQLYNSNTIIVKENCISTESWWKSLLFGHFQLIFSGFSLFFRRNHDFSTQFFRKVTQLTRKVFFSNTETFTSSKNCIKNCIFSPKPLKNFELFWWIVQLLLQLLYDCIVFGSREVKLYDCMW